MSLARHLHDVATLAIGWAPQVPALVVVDRRSPLARRVADAWYEALPGVPRIDVDEVPADAVLARLFALPPGAFVVLVQSTRFELAEFRFRVELHKRGLRVVEQAHLARFPEAEFPVYDEALAYDPSWYRVAGPALAARLAAAGEVRVRSLAGEAAWPGPLEAPRLNVGDYRGMDHVGGQYPIGEVFTEPVELTGVAGRVAVSCYGAADFRTAFVEPFVLELRDGRVVDAPGAPADFVAVLDAITRLEGEVWVRELGFGLNRAMGPHRRLSDVSAYERMAGVHLSLGAKHPVYPKPGFSKRHARFHVDVFVHDPVVEVDGVVVYRDGAYTVAVSA